ncbi:MAG: RDD family protein [Fimbriimonadaceae bacterium]|nr:RDD family protein [Fimbriimonadaceae bacterium]
MTHEFAILSPEKTILTYPLARLGSRVMAHLLDVMLIGVALVGIQFVFGLLSIVEPGLATAVLSLTALLGPFAYFILLEGLWNGQSLGKKAVGIRVRMADGTPVTFGAALGRNLMRPADLFPGSYFVGLLAVFTNPRSQRLGDLVAGTVVVHERTDPPQFHTAPHQVGIHPLESAVGDLRGMTQEEYVALKRLCDRFPELPAGVQERVVREVWLPFAQRRSVPEAPNVHPIFLAEAVVMRYGRIHGLL